MGWRSRLFRPLQNAGPIGPRRSARDRDQLLVGSRRCGRQDAYGTDWRRSSVGARIGDQTACPWLWLFEVFPQTADAAITGAHTPGYTSRVQTLTSPLKRRQIPRSLDLLQSYYRPTWIRDASRATDKDSGIVLEEVYTRNPEPHPCQLDNNHQYSGW